jgi:hypothetical protein
MTLRQSGTSSCFTCLLSSAVLLLEPPLELSRGKRADHGGIDRRIQPDDTRARYPGHLAEVGPHTGVEAGIDENAAWRKLAVISCLNDALRHI